MDKEISQITFIFVDVVLPINIEGAIRIDRYTYFSNVRVNEPSSKSTREKNKHISIRILGFGISDFRFMRFFKLKKLCIVQK